MASPRLAKNGGVLKSAPDAGSGSAVAAVVPELKSEVVDGHTIGAVASEAELAIVEKAEGFAAGSLVKAVADGLIGAAWSRVEVKAANSPTGKGGKRAYVRLTALDIRGAAAICKGVIAPAAAKQEGQPKPQAGVCDYFNYGSDLDRKAPVRAALMTTLEGPEKAVKKMVVGLLAAEMEAAEIRALVKRTPKFANVDGIDKLLDSALAS
jgi:hypothetical protein